MKFLPILIIFITTISVYGRIGETPAQCQKRYGDPVEISKNKKVLTYKKNKITIECYFWKGTAHRITYCKLNKRSFQQDMSEDEIATFLAANKGSSKWKLRQKVDRKTSFILMRGDGKLAASLETRLVFIETVEYTKFRTKKK